MLPLIPRTVEEYRHWRVVRWEAIASAGGICEKCHKEPAVQVHHINYDSYGHERPSDLMAVCDDCHCTLHGIPVNDNHKHQLLLPYYGEKDAA